MTAQITETIFALAACGPDLLRKKANVISLTVESRGWSVSSSRLKSKKLRVLFGQLPYKSLRQFVQQTE
jgi:hypothetical protein